MNVENGVIGEKIYFLDEWNNTVIYSGTIERILSKKKFKIRMDERSTIKYNRKYKTNSDIVRVYALLCFYTKEEAEEILNAEPIKAGEDIYYLDGIACYDRISVGKVVEIYPSMSCRLKNHSGPNILNIRKRSGVRESVFISLCHKNKNNAEEMLREIKEGTYK